MTVPPRRRPDRQSGVVWLTDLLAAESLTIWAVRRAYHGAPVICEVVAELESWLGEGRGMPAFASLAALWQALLHGRRRPEPARGLGGFFLSRTEATLLRLIDVAMDRGGPHLDAYASYLFSRAAAPAAARAAAGLAGFYRAAALPWGSPLRLDRTAADSAPPAGARPAGTVRPARQTLAEGE